MDSDLNTKIVNMAIRKILRGGYGFTNEQVDFFIDNVAIEARKISEELEKRSKKPIEN